MQTWNNDAQYHCTKPEIIASRLTAIRNIYLRQELCTISNQIQEQYKERLPVLHLVSIAAYEQVFNRQPLSLPEELRRDAVKYGLQYYQLNLDKLRMVEARNGLYPNHDRLSCFDKKCPLHQHDTIELKDNHLSTETSTDEDQSNLSDSQRSISSEKSIQNSNVSPVRSVTSENTSDSITTDTNNIATSVSSDTSSTISTNGHNISSVSTFSDTNISYSSTDTSGDTGLNSSSTDPFSDSPSDRSMITVKTNQQSALTKQLSRRNPPKIIIRRASDSTSPSNNTMNSLMTIDSNKISAEKKSMNVRHLSSNKRKSNKKKRNKKI